MSSSLFAIARRNRRAVERETGKDLEGGAPVGIRRRLGSGIVASVAKLPSPTGLRSSAAPNSASVDWEDPLNRISRAHSIHPWIRFDEYVGTPILCIDSFDTMISDGEERLGQGWH